MYYWRSLFYTSVPTRKPIDQRNNNQAAQVLSNKMRTNRGAEEVEVGPENNLLQGIVDEALAQRFQAYSQRTQRAIVFLVAPIRVRRNDEEESTFEYFPFWFPLAASQNNQTGKWEIRCDRSFHNIYVPRKFMSPQSGESDYVIESEYEGTYVFTTCEKYERHYAIEVNQNTSLVQYIDAVKNAFQRMTGHSMDSYRCKEPGLKAEFNPFIHIEKPTDFTKRIRTLFSDNLQQDDVEVPQLLHSLILPNTKSTRLPVSIETDEYSEAGKRHFGQMNNKDPLSRSQRKALLTWLKYESLEDIMVVNGPPGTGKTTLIQSLIATKIVQSAIDEDKPFMALCCASTHKAVTNIIDSFSSDEQNCIRFLPDLNGHVIGYATYVTSKDNEYTKRYFHFKPDSDRNYMAFCKGPLSPGDGNQPGVETEEYINNARDVIREHYEDGLSMDSIVARLHKEVLYFCDRISEGIAAILDFLYENKTVRIIEWYSVLQKDLYEGRLIPGSIQYKEFDPSDECIEEHFQELLDVTYRYSAFVSSIRYWEARWVNEAKITDKRPGDRQEKDRMLRQKAMLTPCFVTTLHSSVSLCSYIREGELNPLFSFADCLILDEAGQTLPEIGTAAFAFAKKAIIFGDAQQLEPIHGLHPKLDIGDLIQSHIPSSKEDISLYEHRCMLASSGNMVGFGQSACNIVEDKALPGQRGIMLVEHRRCRKEIIEYCNKLVYNGLLNPMTAEKGEFLYHPFSFIPIEGESSIPPSNSSRINETEADAIVNWIVEQRQNILTEYKVRYSRLEDIIAIVTPFKAQEKLLNSKLSNIGIKTVMPDTEENDEQEDAEGDAAENGLKPIVVGTVHKLQGAKSPIVIFSSVYGSNDYQMRFIDTKPNMLNVAVSRAQDAFIVFGNASLYHRNVLKYYRALCTDKETNPIPSGLLKVFCNRYDSSTPYIFDAMPYFRTGESCASFSEDCTDGEMVIVDLLNELQMTYSLHVPLSEVYNKIKKTATSSLFNKDELNFILNTDSHYDFLVSMDSTLLAIEVDGGMHDDPHQKLNDQRKDTITNKWGIGMLRLQTRICNSKDEIKHKISDFILSAIPSCYSKKKKSWEITLSMYLDSLSKEEIAKARGMQLDTIKNHLAEAVINQQLDVYTLLSEERFSEIRESVNRVFQSGMTQEGDIYLALDGSLGYDEIKIALAYCQNKLRL